MKSGDVDDDDDDDGGDGWLFNSFVVRGYAIINKALLAALDYRQ